MVDTYIIDKDGNSANAANVTVPADRSFRGAWSLSGNVISEDLDSAKAIFKDKVREVRKPLLDAEDVSPFRILLLIARTSFRIQNSDRNFGSQ